MGSPVPAALFCTRSTTNPAILGCWSPHDSDDEKWTNGTKVTCQVLVKKKPGIAKAS